MILNSEQNEAVIDDAKFIFLLAGAGSGKTRVIIEKIKYLLSKGVEPNKILGITFTNKAADEMIDRLGAINVEIHTFHGYCYQVLKTKKDFQIFEYNQEFDSVDILKIANYKNSLKTQNKPKMYDKYEQYLKSRNLLDFDDLMIDVIPFIRAHDFEYIFIDEFQDTNLLQFKLLESMIHDKTHVFAVGDPDQSIYAFRGAKVDLIGLFIEKYQAKKLVLKQNYRSNKHIIHASNQLIKHNLNRFKKTLESQMNSKTTPLVYIGNTKKIEHKLISTIKEKKLLSAAILYRNHYQVSRLKQVCIRNYLFDVKFYTFHEAKGLEFDAVLIVGLEDLPYDKEFIYKNEEEERRLLFVGLTRAKNHLYLFSTKITKFIKQTKLDVLYI